jgi:hypothetical protein
MSHKTIAKLLGPALLITATLSLPAASAAAPDGRGQQVQHEKQKKQKTVKVKKQKVVTTTQRTTQRQTVVRQARAPRTVYVQPAQYRRNRQPRNQGRPYAGENSPTFRIDGILTEGRRCLALRDHRGNFYTLVGRIEGLQAGDHVDLQVRRVLPIYARECGEGDTVRVGQVHSVWADQSHSYSAYDYDDDGAYRSDWRERYRRERNNRYRGGSDDRYDGGRYDRDGGYDRDRYDDRYDRDDDRDGRIISVAGRLGGSGSCATLRDRDGRLFALSGDLRNYGPGDNVRVIGFLEGGSRCGGTNIEVQEITRP